MAVLKADPAGCMCSTNALAGQRVKRRRQLRGTATASCRTTQTCLNPRPEKTSPSRDDPLLHADGTLRCGNSIIAFLAWRCLPTVSVYTPCCAFCSRSSLTSLTHFLEQAAPPPFIPICPTVMVTIRALAASAIAAAAAVVVALGSGAAAQAQSTEANFARVLGPSGGATCAGDAPRVPFNASLIGTERNAAFECYRPRSPLTFKVRAQALVMTDEDGGYYRAECAGDVIALRFDRGWNRPYFNVKPGFDVMAKFGTDYKLPDRFGRSCDKARAELGIAEGRYGPWGTGRPTFVRLLCLMTRLVRQFRDFRCLDANTPVYKPVQLDSPFATLVTFLESVAYLYMVPV